MRSVGKFPSITAVSDSLLWLHTHAHLNIGYHYRYDKQLLFSAWRNALKYPFGNKWRAVLGPSLCDLNWNKNQGSKWKPVRSGPPCASSNQSFHWNRISKWWSTDRHVFLIINKPFMPRAKYLCMVIVIHIYCIYSFLFFCTNTFLLMGIKNHTSQQTGGDGFVAISKTKMGEI